MFSRIILQCNRVIVKQIRNCSKLNENPQLPQVFNSDILEDDLKVERKSVLEKTDEDLSEWAPSLRPTFNFAAYVNKSETLQQLVKMGVNLHNIEKKVHNVEFIMQLDFERDVKKYMLFLTDLGLSIENIAFIITKNPLILKEDLENLQVRINFLKAKKFTKDQIQSVVSRNAFWLTSTTQQINERLGYFQRQFALTGDETRTLAAQQPRLITHTPDLVKQSIFTIREEMGFLPDEVKTMLLQKPNLFMKSRQNIRKTFDYIHLEMKISLEKIAKMPGVLLCREFKVKERHLFLKKLGKDQFNYREPNYVSLMDLVSGTDAEFCDKIAKTSIETFNDFLKTL